MPVKEDYCNVLTLCIEEKLIVLAFLISIMQVLLLMNWEIKKMTMSSYLRNLTITGVSLIVLVCGCQKEAQMEKPVVKPVAKTMQPKKGEYKIALTPKPGEQVKYKITTDNRKSIVWEGPVPKKEAFEPSSNNDKVEMVITEQIQNINPDGAIVAKVTIDSLKYIQVSKNFTAIDFDSSRPADADNPLNKMIGKGYTIEFKPDNSIISIPDLNDLRAIFSSQSVNDSAAKNILLSDVVMDRQAILTLPEDGNDMLKPSQTWTRNKTFSFGLMGIKSYEKIYELKEVKDVAGDKIAVIDMNAIPSSEVESKFRNQQVGANFPKMFDTSERYTGSGEIDLSKGLVDKYSETLNSTWIAALPPGPGDAVDSNEPVVLKMTAVRSYDLEMIK